MKTDNYYKVVLVFTLKEGQADEELKRSAETDSFPNMLTKQPGFVALELVKIGDSQTMSIQTWENEQAWWQALESVKAAQADMPHKQDRPSILESRDFFGGKIVRSLHS